MDSVWLYLTAHGEGAKGREGAKHRTTCPARRITLTNPTSPRESGMKRVGILIFVMAITFAGMATLPREALPAATASRAATFVGVKGGETLFVERVRDAPGGFHGEVSVTKGSVWIRYRVEVGPDASIRRYELDMNPRGPRGS